MISRPRGFKPRVLNESKPYNSINKAHNKSKPFRSNPKGPIKIRVRKSEIVYVAGVLKRNGKAEIMVPRQWLLTSHDKKKVYVPNPDHERGMNCGIWRKPERQDYWYEKY